MVNKPIFPEGIVFEIKLYYEWFTFEIDYAMYSKGFSEIEIDEYTYMYHHITYFFRFKLLCIDTWLLHGVERRIY